MTLSAKQREKLIEAIYKADGKITTVSKAVKISRATIYRYAQQYATIQNAIDDARETHDEELLDDAETELKKAVKAGEQWAVRYTLDKKGQSRGYVDRREITGANGESINLEVNWITPDTTAMNEDD